MADQKEPITWYRILLISGSVVAICWSLIISHAAIPTHPYSVHIREVARLEKTIDQLSDRIDAIKTLLIQTKYPGSQNLSLNEPSEIASLDRDGPLAYKEKSKSRGDKQR